MSNTEKMTVIPLNGGNLGLHEDEKIELDADFTVERMGNFLEAADTAIWKWSGGNHEEDDPNWDVCLVHRFNGDVQQQSLIGLGYVLAHLRIIRPHRNSIDDYIQLERTSSGNFSALRCGKSVGQPNRWLTDCEYLTCGFERKDLAALKQWMPWVIEFWNNWKKYYPLYLSLFFLERACSDTEFRTRHLFRVMALEALFCSDSNFGKKALRARVPKFIGANVDLYQAYSVEYFRLPKLLLTDSLIDDMYSYRNKIAHADRLPEAWKTDVRRDTLGGDSLNYLDQLTEVASTIARSSWLRMIDENLQNTFADKRNMELFFSDSLCNV